MATSRFVHDAVLDAGKAPPEVEVIFGHQQVGNYVCNLWDSSTATTSRQIAHGNNVDTVLDRFPVGEPAASLKGKLLGFTLVMQTPTAGPGEMFSATVLIRQGDDVVSGGVIQDGGMFPPGTDSVARLHFVRLL
jgi:hypothetical protein